MSAPDTNIEKQKMRHRPALLGMGFAAGFAAALLLGFVVWVFAQSDGPEGADVHVDGRTGFIEEN